MSNELYHYGVKGMRWGVRHDPERTVNRIKKVTYSSGYRKAVRGIGNSPFGKASLAINKKGTELRSKRSSAIKAVNNKIDSKLGTVSSKTKYSKPSDFFKQAGRNYVQNLEQTNDFYKKSYKSILQGKPKEIGKHCTDWLNQDITVIGLTGSKTMKRKRYMSGIFNPLY